MSDRNNENSEDFSRYFKGHDKENRDKEAVAERMSKVRHKIIILSGKGGVGKSTVAVNLASALANSGKRVGLMDIDVHGPSIPRLTGLANEPLTGTDQSINPIKKGPNLSVMSIGFLIPNPDDPVIWRGPLKYSLIRQFLSNVEWGELDYLIIDSPPGTGDEPLSVVQLLSDIDGALNVTTPQEVAVEDVRRSINFCKKVNIPVLGVIENMSGFICPHCGKSTEIFKSGGGERMASEMGVPFLGKIPIDIRIMETSDMGIAHVQHDPKSETAKAFQPIVDFILKLSASAN